MTMGLSDPRVEALLAKSRDEGRPSVAAQRMTIPAWAIGVLVSLLSAGASAAVTYGVTITRVSTVERDVAAALVRVDQVDAARTTTERELAVLKTRLDAIADTGRETREEVRGVREVLDDIRARLPRR
jgi:septal ring factor EnvC (AmiA/AmiB activator)